MLCVICRRQGISSTHLFIFNFFGDAISRKLINYLLCCSLDEGSKPINCEIGTVTMLRLNQVTEKGLAEEKKKQVLDRCHRSDYSVVVTSGQRKYGGPPLNWIDPPPTCGSEVTAICVTLFIFAFIYF